PLRESKSEPEFIGRSFILVERAFKFQFYTTKPRRELGDDFERRNLFCYGNGRKRLHECSYCQRYGEFFARGCGWRRNSVRGSNDQPYLQQQWYHVLMERAKRI